MSYQRGARDAWHHWYEYDADNRITQVYTSTHPDPIAMAGTTITDPTVVSALWEQDSKYFYYAHGPLMRQELGSNQVQGVDYAYTLQGWIKGINSNALDATKDMGHDGSGTGLNGRFARDVASFSLSYYEGDFSSVASTGAFSSVVGSDLEAQSAELYNGNIRIMQTTLMENNGSGALTASNLGMAYKYDQLNRLKQAKGFTQYTPSTNSWSASSGAAGEHNNFFTFDANGNIVAQQRYEGSTLVDNLSYQYATNSAGDLLSNRLYSVDDAVMNASLSATDMEDMPTYINASPNTSNNYTYTQIGELKSDNQEEISEIHWRVDSKISEITRTSGSSKKNLKFEYDAMGNRVAKHVYAGSVLASSTYYVRDAQGNVMGVYEHKMDAENAVLEYRLIERNIYGSAQVGICKDTVDLNITNASGALTQATYYHARQLNHRQYSLSNHLGNVLTTLGDGKAPVDSNSDGVIDYFTAYIISVSDYSPFGVELADRTWSIEEYRSGFQKQEKDKELWEGAMYYKYRVEDPRLGRFFSVDPLYAKYPHNSNYAFSENVLINAVEWEGLEAFFVHGTISTNERWKNKGHELVDVIMQITNNKTTKTDFDWSAKWYGIGTSHLFNDENDRYFAALSLAYYVRQNKVKGEEVTLIGHSHGVNVSIQAARMLYDFCGIKVNIISIAAPAYNSYFSSDSNTWFIGDIEDPQGNPGINDMIHIWNPQDIVSGGYAGDDTYDSDSGVRNIKIDVRINDSDFDSHSFDFEKPGLILNKIKDGSIGKMKKVENKYVDGKI